MKKRKIIGTFTVLSGFPGLGTLYLFWHFDSISAGLLALAVVAFLLRGVAGVVGGILLWRGSRLGYQLAIACWGYLAIIGGISLYQLYSDGIPLSLDADDFNMLYLKQYVQSLGKMIWGVPLLYVLSRDLLSGTGTAPPQSRASASGAEV